MNAFLAGMLSGIFLGAGLVVLFAIMVRMSEACPQTKYNNYYHIECAGIGVVSFDERAWTQPESSTFRHMEKNKRL